MRSKQDQIALGKIFSDYHFTMTTAQLNQEKLYYRDIQRMLDEGLIEKVKRGYYHWIEDCGTSEAALISRLFPDAVFCMETALFYYQYSDRTPAEWNITVDKNTSRQRTNMDYPFVKVYRVEPALCALGETDGMIEHTKVRIYDRDRTICDVLRNMNKMDREIFNKAIQRYVTDAKKKIPNLMQYAKALRVQKKVTDLIGVWL